MKIFPDSSTRFYSFLIAFHFSFVLFVLSRPFSWATVLGVIIHVACIGNNAYWLGRRQALDAALKIIKEHHGTLEKELVAAGKHTEQIIDFSQKYEHFRHKARFN